MTERDLQALMKGITPFLKDQFRQRDDLIKALEKRLADLEEQATRP